MPIYKQQDGSYLVKVNYTDENGKYKQALRKNVETKTKAGAQRLEAQLILELTGTSAEKLASKEAKILANMTFADLVEDYLENAQHEHRSSSVRQKKQNCRLYLIPFFGRILINDFTPSLIQRWKNRMDKEVSKRSGKPLSVGYKNTVHKTFCACLNYASKFYGYNNTAYKRISRFTDTFSFAEDKEIHYWTYKQFRAFSSALRRDCEKSEQKKDLNAISHWGVFVIFNILFFCGLRKGEAYPLHWTDIKDRGSYFSLSITKSMNQKADFEITPPKNRSSIREVPICQELLHVLEEHYNRYTHVYGFDPLSDIWYICGGLNPSSDTLLENTKNDLARTLGLPKIRIHDLRHSFVSMLINADVNIKTISKLVGHSTVDQTWNTYGHLYPDKENEAIKMIDSLTCKL